MTIYQPYTYLIGWSKHNKWYYGARWGKGCHPSDLWNTYFTSSKRVKRFREEYGEPDVVEVRKTFDDAEKVRFWEEKVQRRLNVIREEKWLNRQYGGSKFCSDGDPETSKKIAKALRGRIRPEEERQKMRKPKKKGYKQTLDHIEKRSSKRRNSYIVTTPDNKTIIVDGLYKFCRENNLKYGASNMLNGWSYKGYKATRI